MVGVMVGVIVGVIVVSPCDHFEGPGTVAAMGAGLGHRRAHGGRWVPFLAILALSWSRKVTQGLHFSPSWK